MSGEDMSRDDKKPGSKRGEISQEDRAAFRKRAADLTGRLDAVRARKAPEPERGERGAAMGQAFRISIELVVGVAVGGFIGWALDRQFGSVPWLMVLFLILGFAAGLMNVIRSARKMQAKAEHMQRSAPSVRDDDEDDR